MEYMREIAAQSFSGPAILANLSYILLILAVLMSKVTALRVLAIASGITGFLFLWIFLGDRVASVWEALFILANLVRLAIDFYRERTSRFTPDELIFRNSCIPGLSSSDARRLLSTSTVIEAPAGSILTSEGEAVATLAYILSGEVEIKVGESVISRCKRADFVGEIGVMGTENATATAVATTPIRYLAFDGAALRKLVARDRGIGHELELAFRHSLREKLMRANASLAVAPTGNAA
jgi:CRP-like cAMP-binding protein